MDDAERVLWSGRIGRIGGNGRAHEWRLQLLSKISEHNDHARRIYPKCGKRAAYRIHHNRQWDRSDVAVHRT